MASLQCTIVTPERTVCDEPTEFVALPLFDGEIGIAPGRSPLIGRLGFGELRVGHGDEGPRFYVEGGFVEVLNNVVSVITGRAIPAAEIDAAGAREQLATAQDRPAHSPDALAARDRAVTIARAQLRVARRAEK